MSYEVFAIYCDDVRQEAGGKISLMGLYRGSMLLPQFPFTIRQLFAVVILSCTPEEYPKHLTIRLTLDSNLLTSMDFDLPPPPRIVDVPSTNPDPDEVYKAELQTIIDMPHLTFEAPCRLRLRVIVDGVELRGPGIDIVQLGAYPPPAAETPA